MLVKDNEFTLRYKLPATNEDLSSAIWEVAFEDPEGNNGFISTNIVSVPTSSTSGEVTITTTSPRTGYYTLKLIRGTHDSYKTLHKDTYYVADHDTLIKKDANKS